MLNLVWVMSQKQKKLSSSSAFTEGVPGGLEVLLRSAVLSGADTRGQDLLRAVAQRCRVTDTRGSVRNMDDPLLFPKVTRNSPGFSKSN